ncbi:sulfite exporter TauE/SafE family protein [Phormidesmis sp. 146-12]
MTDPLSLPSALFLVSAGVFAGVMNGLAGGGGLIGFPALITTGILPIAANATNAAALWFGTVASSVAYRRELPFQKTQFLLLSVVSIVGGVWGSYLLLHTPQAAFEFLIPYLMLTATVLFAIAHPLTKWLEKQRLEKQRNHSVRIQIPLGVIVLLQFAIAVYGGFYGGGGGILMLSVLELMGLDTIHTMNGWKNWLATCINAAAIINFSFAGTIVWKSMGVMAIGALLGGYSSAYFARQIDPLLIRYFIIGVSSSITAYFFWYHPVY